MSNNATAELSDEDVRDKARADYLLAETKKILTQLEAERRKVERRRLPSRNIVAEVKAILHGTS
jgi:hypothetical protein